MKRVALVSCSAIKAAQTEKARDLYRSPLFKKALAYAERHFDEVRILSAKHGVVHPDERIDPYDQKLDRASDVVAWGLRVRSALLAEFPPPAEFTLFAGQLYAGWAGKAHGELRVAGYAVREPLRHLQVGERLAWFNAREGTPRGGIEVELLSYPSAKKGVALIDEGPGLPLRADDVAAEPTHVAVPLVLWERWLDLARQGAPADPETAALRAEVARLRVELRAAEDAARAPIRPVPAARSRP